MQAKSGGSRAKQPLGTRTLGPKDMRREVRQEGGCSSLTVRGWWMLRMNSHGFEISIAGYVVEMLCDPNPMPFFFSFFFFMSFVLFVI